jgi:hypothetical protein
MATSERDWPNDVGVGDLIRLKRPDYGLGRVPRQVIEVDTEDSGFVYLAGTVGGQRNTRLRRATLRRYELVRSASTGQEEGRHGD